MAKKNGKSTNGGKSTPQNNEGAPSATQAKGQGTPQATPSAQPSGAQAQPGSPELTLTPTDPNVAVLRMRLTEKGGLTSYARDGVRASVYVSKNLFADSVLPGSLTITAANLAQPSVKVAAAADPAKLKEMAEKAQARAKKALERVSKLTQALGATPATK